jgi:hypothetical protein
MAIPASFLPCRFQTAAKAQFIREFRRACRYSNAGPSIVAKAGRFMRSCERVGICGRHVFVILLHCVWRMAFMQWPGIEDGRTQNASHLLER